MKRAWGHHGIMANLQSWKFSFSLVAHERFFFTVQFCPHCRPTRLNVLRIDVGWPHLLIINSQCWSPPAGISFYISFMKMPPHNIGPWWRRRRRRRSSCHLSNDVVGVLFVICGVRRKCSHPTCYLSFSVPIWNGDGFLSLKWNTCIQKVRKTQHQNPELGHKQGEIQQIPLKEGFWGERRPKDRVKTGWLYR